MVQGEVCEITMKKLPSRHFFMDEIVNIYVDETYYTEEEIIMDL